MSTTGKRLILIGVAAVFCLLAVGAAVGGLALLGNRVKNSVVTDPAKVQQMAHGFINYQLPPDYKEQMGMDFLVYKMIMISPVEPTTRPLILLAQFQAGNMTADQMSQQMQQSMAQQNGSSGLKLKVVETRSVTINGKQVPLTVSEGSDQSGLTLRQWITAFPGKSGAMTLVMIQGSTEQWDDAAFDSFLSSITW